MQHYTVLYPPRRYLGFPLTVPAAANLSAALARLFAIKVSAIAWAVRNRARAGELRAIARRTHIASRALCRRSTLLVEIARRRQRLAA